MSVKASRVGRSVLFASLVLVLGIGLIVPAGKVGGAMADETLSPPNIVVITVDDLDANTLDVAAAEGFMPNYSALKGSGVTFTNAFVTDSLCCPSRATFLTGMYAHNHDVHHESCREFQTPVNHESSTVATWLSASQPSPDYYTGIVGKYLNGYGSGGSAFGDDNDCRDADFVANGWDAWHVLVSDPAGGGSGNPQQMYDYNTRDYVDGGLFQNEFNSYPYGSGGQATYQTSVLTQKATGFIDRWFAAHSTQHFFLWVTPTAPHFETAADPTDPFMALCDFNPDYPPDVPSIRVYPPYNVWADDAHRNIQLTKNAAWGKDITNGPTSVFDFVDDIDSNVEACDKTLYRDQIESLKPIDLMLGAIRSSLSAHSVLGTTLIVFTSDNGFFHGEHNLQNKVLPYEEGIRVPLVMKFGTATPAASTVSDFVVNTDLAPTIAQLAGVPGCTDPLAICNDADGQSLVPFLTGSLPPSWTWRKRFMLESWKSTTEITFPDDLGPPFPTYTGIRTGATDTSQIANSMYTVYQAALGDQPEYYNQLDGLGRDQSANLVGSCSTACTKLVSLLADLKTCGMPSFMTCRDAEKEAPPP
jgi:arylsulfatase A-like enzyme